VRSFHVVADFLHGLFRGAIQHHLELALFDFHHHRLLAHPPDHVKRRLRLAPQRQLQDVRLDALLEGLAQRLLNGKEPIRRTQAFEPLVRALVVVVFHPQPDAVPRLLEGSELGATEELVPDRLPEPLDLAQRHRVMRLAAEVMDVVFLELLLEPRLAPPRGVLPPIVRKHLPGHSILGQRAAIDFQHVLTGLAAEQFEPHQIARVVIHEADQIRLLAADAESADIALPQLHRRGPLKETRLGRVAFAFSLGLGHQLVLVQCLPYRLGTRRQEQHPPHPLGDPPDAELRLFRFQPHDGLLYRDRARTGGGHRALAARLQTGLAILPVTPDPAPDGVGRQMQLLRYQAHDEALFQM